MLAEIEKTKRHQTADGKQRLDIVVRMSNGPKLTGIEVRISRDGVLEVQHHR